MEISSHLEKLDYPSLSIVIPAHNEAEIIGILLDLIKNENFPCEIIVSNSGSTDATAAVIQAYIEDNPQLNLHLVDSQLGVSKARNDGANAASGEIVLFLDADTGFKPGFIRKALDEFLEKKLDAGSFDMDAESDQMIDRVLIEIQNRVQGVLQHMSEYVICIGAGMIAKRKFHQEEIGGFEEDRKVYEDAVWGQMAARKGKFGIINTRITFNMVRFKKNGRVRFLLKHVINGIRSVWLGIGPSKSMKEEYAHDRYGNEFR